MKKVFLCLAMAALVTACSNNKSDIKAGKPDTTKTLALYRTGPGGREAKVELVYRINKDSFMMVQVDSNTAVRKLTRVSQYFVPILDSAKKLVFIPYPNEMILIDGGKNVDSIFKVHSLRFALPKDTARAK